MPAATTAVALTSGEARTERVFEAAKSAGPPELYAFLRGMPKGADLHMHLSGAVYAETFIAEAAQQGLCVAPVEPGVPAVPVAPDTLRFAKPVAGKQAACGAGSVPASDALKDQHIYDDLIDSLSMRGYVPTPGITGHDQFFDTFARFGALDNNYAAQWLDEVARRAAAQNEQYLEIMQTPSFSRTAALAYALGWPRALQPGHDNPQEQEAEFASLRQKLLDGGLRDDVTEDIHQLNGAESSREQMEHCSRASGDPSGIASAPAYGDANAHGDAAACGVTIRWLYQILRGYPPQQVFAQTVLGFEVASADPEVVGINFVMPEDGRISMQDYHLQMQMLDYLHTVYPRVHISLHAGELAFGMVPPEGLSFHIRQAIDLGHAQRIGHGVDVLYEDRPAELLQEMAAKHIMVEINLTSNAVILGVEGKRHPLSAYRAAHVPVALSTDDEGVSRIDLTHEYVKGAEEQELNYLDLKQMARTSLEHAFLRGESLWAAPDAFTRRNSACAAPITPESSPSGACAAFLQANERAAEQWQLERRFALFEMAH
jgi:adenosine deaminase